MVQGSPCCHSEPTAGRVEESHSKIGGDVSTHATHGST